MAVKESYDGTWESTYLFEVSVAELLISFLCTCLPTYGPLYRRVFTGSLDSSKSNSRPQFSSGQYRNDMSARHCRVTVQGSSGTGPPKSGIHVTKDIDMSTFTKKSTTWVRVADDDEARLTASANRHPPGSDGQSFETLPER